MLYAKHPTARYDKNDAKEAQQWGCRAEVKLREEGTKTDKENNINVKEESKMLRSD